VAHHTDMALGSHILTVLDRRGLCILLLLCEIY